MMQQVLSRFPLTEWTGVGLVLFLSVFIGAAVWVFRSGSEDIYRQMGELPFHD